MKNIRRLLAATAVLVSAGSMATIQPIMPVSEDNPIRINAGLVGGLQSPESEFGLGRFGGGLSLAHNVGYDVEYGLAFGADFRAHKGNIFVKSGEKSSGIAPIVEAMLRFMPELAEQFKLGGWLAIAWDRQLSENAKVAYEKDVFGDLSVRVGPALSYGITEMISLYFGVNYAFTNIRFGGQPTDAVKKKSNLSGVEVPLGFWFAFNETTGMFIEANTKFKDVTNFTKSWQEDVVLGVGFSI